jgi:hypothetical protein
MTDSIKKNKPDFEFLGQKFYLPDSELKLAGFAIIIICLTGLIYHLIDRKNLEKTKDGWAFTNGVIEEKTELKNGTVLGFWTPSDSTKNGLKPMDTLDSSPYVWQTGRWQMKFGKKKTMDSLNIDFGTEIKSKFRVKGYRRFRVCGEGDSKLKEGWWWNVGLEGDCDRRFLNEFKTAYIEFWCSNLTGQKWDNLYVEIIGNLKPEK